MTDASATDGSGPRGHRVVIVGGGFGGIEVAKGLAGAPVHVTLIDRTNHHLFQPLLYQVATGVLSPGQIAPALRSMFRDRPNVEVLLGTVGDVDLERRVVRMAAEHETEVPYDSLVLAAGSAYSYFGHEEWAELAPGMKTIDDAVRLRSRILSAFEFAEQATDPAERQEWMTFAIVGGGPTGVELAGQVSALARHVLRGEYRHIDPATARIVLLDAGDAVLNTYPHSLSRRAERDLRRLGVDVELHSPVTAVDLEGVVTGSGDTQHRIRAKTVIWAAGVTASPLGTMLAERSGAQVDRSGRLHAEPDLTLPGHPEVFVIGDMVAINGVPGTAQPAIQEGKYVARVIRARIEGRPAKPPFHYVNLGDMAVIGRTDAVANLFGRVRLGGFPAFVIWGFVHLVNLVGWGNRFEAVTRWLWTILARNRRERLISMESLADDPGIDQELADVQDYEAHEREPENAAEHPPENAAERPPEQAAQHPPEQAAEPPSEHPPEQHSVTNP